MAQPRSQPNAHHQPQHQQLLDALYCEEERFDQVKEEGEDSHYRANARNDRNDGSSITQTPILTEEDLSWEEGELRSLLFKQVQNNGLCETLESNSALAHSRRDGVDWMLRVSSHYDFSAYTAVLAVNCLDRFLYHFQCQKEREKPWMIQLAAVACLSLAAKVEETQVPLLLDLQVEDSRFVFEAKTIQRMEILVLSTLQWKMNPVTPLSFLDHIARRAGLKDRPCCEFLRKSESLLLSTLGDSRFMRYLPSVLAMSIMMHALDGLVVPCIGVESLNQLWNGVDKDKVGECCQMIREVANSSHCSHKRKVGQAVPPGSPSGVMDLSFSCDSSNDSWAATAAPASVSSSPEPPSKKSRGQEAPLAQLLPIPR